MAKLAPVMALPIWDDCSCCTRLGTCEDAFPPSGDCPHPVDHILGPEHRAKRWPRHWNFYSEALQTDLQLGSIFFRWQLGKATLESDFFTLRGKVLEDFATGKGIASGARWLLFDFVDDDMKVLHGDFMRHYDLDDEVVAWALQAAFSAAIITAPPEYVEPLVGEISGWELYRRDVTCYWLWGLLELKYLDLSRLRDSEFQAKFEKEWVALQPYRGTRFNFRVIPKLGWNDFVRYQRLSKGDPAIRSALSCYMTHQALAYPQVMKVIASNFNEVTFFRWLPQMYAPLLNKTVRMAAKNLGLKKQQIQEREDIRASASAAFDKFLKEFEFFWRPKGEERKFGEYGFLGLQENKELRQRIDVALVGLKISLSTQDMAVYVFAHYINERMRYWAKTNYPADPAAVSMCSMDATTKTAGGETLPLQDTFTAGSTFAGDAPVDVESVWPLDAEAYVDEEADIVGPDGTPYMFIRQAGRYFGLSEDQLRRMDNAGSFKALRVKDVFGEQSSMPSDLRLYPRTAEAAQAAEIAKQRARTRSSQNKGKELNRK